MSHVGIRLLRSIYREHRKLPQKMREMGDQYVRQEFKLHKSVKDKKVLDQFYMAWTDYLHHLKSSRGQYGRSMDEAAEKLNKEQIEKFNELKEEIRKSFFQ